MTYKQSIESMVYNLMYSALELADIIDQDINEHGMITVQYQFASQIIKGAQQAAKDVAEELTSIVSGFVDLSEIYPEQKGGAA